MHRGMTAVGDIVNTGGARGCASRHSRGCAPAFFNALQDAPVSVQLRRTPPPAAVRRRSRRRRPIRPCSTTSRRPRLRQSRRRPRSLGRSAAPATAWHGFWRPRGQGLFRGGTGGGTPGHFLAARHLWHKPAGAGVPLPMRVCGCRETARQAGWAGMGGTALEPVTPLVDSDRRSRRFVRVRSSADERNLKASERERTPSVAIVAMPSPYTPA
jgi:hypothetical protein